MINNMTLKDATILKWTTDDWCPNFHDTLVEVSFHVSIGPGGYDGCSRVCVWGADDIGMELDGDDAEETFLKIIQLDDLTFDNLKELGLKPA